MFNLKPNWLRLRIAAAFLSVVTFIRMYKNVVYKSRNVVYTRECSSPTGYLQERNQVSYGLHSSLYLHTLHTTQHITQHSTRSRVSRYYLEHLAKHV